MNIGADSPNKLRIFWGNLLNLIDMTFIVKTIVGKFQSMKSVSYTVYVGFWSCLFG